MYMAEASVRLMKFSDARFCVTSYLGFLAGNAGCRPLTNISGDGVPYVLRLDHLDGRLSGWMGEAVNDVEDFSPKSRG